MKLPLEWKINLGLGIVFLAMCLIGITAWKITLRLEDAIRWTDHSDAVMTRLEGVNTEVLEMQSAFRGFLIRPLPRWADNFKAVSDKIPDSLQELRQLVSDNAAQQRRLDRIEMAVAEVKANMQKRMLVRQNQDLAAALVVGVNPATTSSIRELIEETKDVEQGLLAERSRQVQAATRVTIETLAASLFLVAILLGIAAVLLRRDILSDRTRSEEVRTLNASLSLQNRRLEEANNELEAFSYSVSHDLRAPLRHIDGFANLLKEQAEAELNDQGRHYLDTISGAAQRMGQLIDDLLRFSRMGRTQMALTVVDNDALVASIVRECEVEAGRRPIDWRIAPLPNVKADLPMLRQVWTNLIENAVKYTRQSPQPRIEIESSTAAGEHVFSVRDNGVGFDMKHSSQLFGVFHRLHTAADFKGTGIGLAIVRRVVARHGGRTWAESRVGEGTSLHFSLPTGEPVVASGVSIE